MILGGREINEGMPAYVVNQLIKEMILSSINVENAKILMMGISFKENCPDIRNTKVVEIYKELIDLGANVDVFDPWVKKEEAKKEFQIDLIDEVRKDYYDAILICVKHDSFKKLGLRKIRFFGKTQHVLYDLKYLFGRADTELRL